MKVIKYDENMMMNEDNGKIGKEGRQNRDGKKKKAGK